MKARQGSDCFYHSGDPQTQRHPCLSAFLKVFTFIIDVNWKKKYFLAAVPEFATGKRKPPYLLSMVITVNLD